MELDDASDDDSDYKDDDESVNENLDGYDNKKSQLEKKPIDEISHKRKRIADELWDEMNNVETVDVSNKMHKAVTPFYQQKIFNGKIKFSNSSNVKDMLNSIFGKSSKVISSSSSSHQPRVTARESNDDETVRKDDIKRAVKGLKQKGKVIEKVKFAGQEIL